MKKILLMISLVFGGMTAVLAFPSYDSFNYAGGTLWGQTDAMGDFWWEIDSSGTAANAVDIVSGGLSYPGLPTSPGNSALLRNLAGPGARMFVGTNTYFTNGPLSVYYSMVLDVTNIANLSATGDYCFGFNDQGTVAVQTSQPGTMAARVYFKKNGTNYQMGISKQGGVVTNYAPTLFNINQTNFIVVDYEIATSDATAGTGDNVRLWINPAPGTFGAQTRPAETVSILAQDANMTTYLSTFVFENRATDTPNDILVDHFRMGTNWSWVTGGPFISKQPPASANFNYGGALNLNVTALNNGSANTYQWQFGGVNLTNGPSISGSGATVSGVTTASLAVTNSNNLDAGAYSVIVSNAVGAVTSSVANVSIIILSSTQTPVQNVYAGQNAQFSVSPVGNASPVFQWQVGPGLAGPFSNLTDGPTGTGSTISGSSTATLTIANVSSSDVLYYQCIANIGTLTNTSVPAPLTLLVSTLADITQPGDPITDFGHSFNTPVGLGVTNAIDGTMATYLNYGGSGTNIGPFVGPVGIIVTPNAGNSIVSALRFFTAVNATICDPADYMLEGSNDGGNTWATIVPDSPLALPNQRNLTNSGPINITNQFLQEVDFANTTGYSTYRLTVNNVKNNSTANSMQIAEIQFLGSLTPIAPGILVQPAPASPKIFVGNSITLGVTANGPSPFTYQWYFNATNAIAGATATSYTVNNAQLTDTGNYTVVVGNAYGPTTSSVVSLTVISPPGNYASTIVGDQPIAYWRLDEAEIGGGDNGVVANDYMGAHFGIYTNVVLGAQGYSAFDTDTAMAVGTQNTSASYMGRISGAINFAAPTNSNGSFTIEAWAAGNQPTSTAQIAGAGVICLGMGNGGEQFAIDCGAAANDFRFYFREAGGGSITANSAVGATNNIWHHLVGVVDEPNNKQLFFIDGRMVVSNSLAAGAGVLNVSSPTNLFTIGTRTSSTTSTTPTNQFQGSIDEVAIYNYALTGTQVQNHYFAAGIVPTLTTAPTNATVNEGTTATFFSAATGTPNLGYQWYQSVDSGVSFQVLNGQTSPNLTLNNVSRTQNGYEFEVVVTNSYGTNISTPVTLTVLFGAPQITTDLQPSYNFYAGFPITVSVTVGGTVPFTYGWYTNGVPLSNDSRISGAQSNVLTIASAQLGDSGNYQLFVTNSSGTGNSIVAAVTVVPVLGFNGLGMGWSMQGTRTSGLYSSSNVLQLTYGLGNERNSSFFNYPVYVGAFRASWTYQVLLPNANPADGVAFVVQNDPRGASALGTGGGDFGYGLTGSITPSAALEMNIFKTAAGGVGFAFDTNGAIGPNTSSAPVNLASGDPIAVNLTYLNGLASLTLKDTTTLATYTTNTALNLTNIVGGTSAFVGFTGADGGSVSSQIVSNFTFISLIPLTAQVSGSNIVLTWPTGVGGYALQQNANLAVPNWQSVANPVSVVGGSNQVTVPMGPASAYFRLVLP